MRFGNVCWHSSDLSHVPFQGCHGIRGAATTEHDRKGCSFVWYDSSSYHSDTSRGCWKTPQTGFGDNQRRLPLSQLWNFPNDGTLEFIPESAFSTCNFHGVSIYFFRYGHENRQIFHITGVVQSGSNLHCNSYPCSTACDFAFNQLFLSMCSDQAHAYGIESKVFLRSSCVAKGKVEAKSGYTHKNI